MTTVMTPMARVLAALTGEPSAERARTLVLSLYGSRLTDCPLREYYSNPSRYLDGQRAVAAAFGPDILFSPFALTLEAQAFGCQLHHQDQAPPNVKRPAVRSLRDHASVARKDIAESPGLAYLVESLRLLVQEFGSTTPIAGILTAPTDLPAMLFGIEGWLEALLFDQQAAQAIMDVATDHFLAMSQAMFQAGASAIVTPVMFCNPRIVSREIAARYMIPLLAKAYATAGGPIIFHHGGNRLSGFLPLFAGLPNVVGYALDERDTFAEARSALGEHPVLVGNMSGPHLSRRSPDEVARRVENILEDRRDDPRFILCSSSADVPWDTPLENIQAFFKTAGRRGQGA